MASADMSITFEIEPIVKLYCTATSCKFNLMNSYLSQDRQATCILKHLTISHEAKCKSYEPYKVTTND